MRRIFASMLIIVLLFFSGATVFASANQYMLRRSDTLPEEELATLDEDTVTAQEEYEAREELVEEQRAEAEAEGIEYTESESNEPTQLINLYGWFEPVDSSNVSANFATIGENETRFILGEPKSGKYLETIKAFSRDSELTIKYASRLDGQDWGPDAIGMYDLAESTGNTDSDPVKMNNIRMYFDGPKSLEYEFFYRVYAQDYGWQPWVSNNYQAIPDGIDTHIESLEIRVMPKGSTPPPDTVDAETVPVLTSSAYMQDVGWGSPSMGKNIAIGSIGENRRLEAFTVSSDNPNLNIEYQTFLADVGWTDWVSNGAQTGTTGESRMIEAVRFRLSGPDSEKYDVYYQAHVQYYGWLDWANDGQIAGTTEQGLRMEAFQIRILPKGAMTPGLCEVPSIIAMDRTEGEMIRELNLLRIERGIAPVTGDPKLHEAAEIRSEELAEEYSHMRPDGRGYETVLEDVDFRDDNLVPALGENILTILDPVTASMELARKQACLKVMLTDYYKYMAFVAMPSEDGSESGYSVMLLTDAPSREEPAEIIQ